eukprot:scaffold210236_cov30-Tisochrysis_lutea.AAC.1
MSGRRGRTSAKGGRWRWDGACVTARPIVVVPAARGRSKLACIRVAVGQLAPGGQLFAASLRRPPGPCGARSRRGAWPT